MKFYTRFLSLLMAGVLVVSLAGCGTGGTADESAAPTVTPSAEPSPEPSLSPTDSPEMSTGILPADFVPDTSVEDLCQAIFGVPGTFELFTVNGNPVSAYSFLYWLSSSGYELESSLASYGLTLDWTLDPALSDMLKDAAQDSAVRYAIVNQKAQELGYQMTQEQIDELDANFALLFESVGGADVFKEELRKSGIDYDTYYTLQTTNYHFSLLYKGLFSDHPTDAEINAYIEEDDLLRAKHILLSNSNAATGEALDETAVAEKKATAEQLLSQLQSSTDLLTDFDTLMAEYSEDPGSISNPDGYTFTAGDMVTEFEEATRALEYGQISGIVESPYGYHIILRLDPNTEELRNTYRSAMMSNQLATWSTEAQIVLTEEYEALDAALCYEKYIAYLQAFAAEASAEDQTNS